MRYPMHTLPSLALALLAAFSLNACVSSIKPKTTPLDLYDFGLQAATQPVDFSLPVENLSATDAIQHSNIRYRLNYKNPSQVFVYAESRWASPPVELLRQKLVTTPSSHAGCSLKLYITAFDHVFDDANSSYGVVQLQVSLMSKRSRKPLASTLVSAQSPASGTNARGGVAALDAASTEALQSASRWASVTSAAASECQPSNP